MNEAQGQVGSSSNEPFAHSSPLSYIGGTFLRER